MPQLAAIPESYYTAYGSLLNLKLQPQYKVLVCGASSGLGIDFMKLAKAHHYLESKQGVGKVVVVNK